MPIASVLLSLLKAKALCVVNGSENPVFHLGLRVVLGEQQNMEARVARWEPVAVGSAPLDYERELPEAPDGRTVTPGCEQKEPFLLFKSQRMQQLERRVGAANDQVVSRK